MDGFVKHARSGLMVNPSTGEVIGRSGRLVGFRATGGYVAVGWNEDGRVQGAKVHRMVWEVVNGPIPDDKEINHINGIKTDNRIQNLEVVTRLENMRHAYATGLNQSIGERNGRAKLTAQQVAEIRHRYASGDSAYRIAKIYGMGQTTIRNIVHGRRWVA